MTVINLLGLGQRPLGGAGRNNTVLYNSIHSNGGLGINLGADGVTPNDAGDADDGPNGLLNFPLLTSAITGGSATTIRGTFNARASREYTLQFFSDDACDASGHGEGRVYLGEQNITTDAGGNAAFEVVLPTAVQPGRSVTATATFLDATGGNAEQDFLTTSEFSACRTAAEAAATTPTPTPTPTPEPTPTTSTVQFSAASYEAREGAAPPSARPS